MTRFEHGQFSWVDLVAHDMAAARRFYEEFFGWKSITSDTKGGPPYAMFELEGNIVAGIGQMSEEMKAQGIPPMWNSYINVDDIHATAKKATELGATLTVPVMKVLDAGWLAFMRDPTGGQVGLWQKDQHPGAARINAPATFCWNELNTREADRARDFYGQLLGWTSRRNEHAPSLYHITQVQGRDHAGILQMTAEWGDMAPHWTVYFAVADMDRTQEKLTQLGGKALVPPFQIPMGRLSVVSDPQGAIFHVVQLTEPIRQ